MAQHMITPPNIEFVDKRRSSTGASVADENTRKVGKTFFTTNAAGSTTTAVGAVTALDTGTNVARLGDKFKLFDSAGALKEETVFEITAVSATGATVTFTPAAGAASGSGSTLRFVGIDDYKDNESLDERLFAISSTNYSLARLDTMTQNDKIYALRVNDDPGSI